MSTSETGIAHARQNLLTRRQALLAVGAGLLTARNATAAQQTQTLVSADVHIANYPTVQAVTWFKDYLQGESGGRLDVRIMHSGQLGRENDTVDLVRYGVIDMARVHIGAINNAIPEAQVFALPYLFTSSEHIRRVMDGEPGQQVLAAMRARGMVGLAWYDAGPRCFYNTLHPVQVPADLHGLKLRVPISDVSIDLVRTLQGNPTPLGYGDTYASLQTRLIDGAENNWQSFRSSRHFEVAQYWSQSEHSYAPDVLLMSARKFDQLSKTDQQLLQHAARQSVAHMRLRWDQTQAEARDAVLKAGVKVNEVDREAFARASQPVIDKYAKNSANAALIAAARAMA